MHQLRLQVVRTADDDGGNAATVTASEVVGQVETANAIFAAADVRFVYDPDRDFFHVNSTLLNRTLTALEPLEKATDPNRTPAASDVPNSRARLRFAELFMDRIVVFFSYKSRLKFDAARGHWVLGPGGAHSSAGLGGYVGMLSTATGSILAHELGHFLQNRHTFGPQPDVSNSLSAADRADAAIKQAAGLIKQYVEGEGKPRASGADVFDGDAVWVTDTPPDPGEHLFADVHGNKCGAEGTVEVPVKFSDGTERSYALTPDRANFMSYFRCVGIRAPVRMSGQQAWRVRDALETGLRHRLIALRGMQAAGQLTRRGSESAGAVSQIATVAVGGGRVVTAVRDSTGDLKVIAWDLGATGATVLRRGSGSGGTVKRLAACYAGLGMVVTAVRTAGDTLKLIVWRVDEAGGVTRVGEASAGAVGDVISVCRVGMELVATAVRTSAGDMEVIAWHVSASGAIVRQQGATAGGVSRLAMAESWPLTVTNDGDEHLGYGQLTTGVRDSAGKLKLMNWAIERRGQTVTRLESAQAGAVDTIALCPLPPRTLISAVRTGSGTLKIISWMLNDAGLAIDRWESAGAGAVSEIAVCPAGVDLFATAVRTGPGDLKVIIWQSLADGAGVARLGDQSAGAATQITLCQAAPGLLATALRDADGNLKVISWRLQ